MQGSSREQLQELLQALAAGITQTHSPVEAMPYLEVHPPAFLHNAGGMVCPCLFGERQANEMLYSCITIVA